MGWKTFWEDKGLKRVLRRLGRGFLTGEGKIRLWAYLLLAAGLYFLATGGFYALFQRLYTFMMGVWGVTQSNVGRAPGWIRWLYRWSEALASIAQGALLVCFALALNALTHRKGRPAAKGFFSGALPGAAGALALWGALMLMGSVRLGWRLTRPAFSTSTLSLFLTTLALALGEAAFLYGAAYGEMKRRMPRRAALGIMLIVRAATSAWAAPMHPVAWLNGALTALACCLMADWRGASTAAGFRFAWNYLSQGVLGFAGASAALYETYPVNRYWLCGGNAGPAAGWMQAAVTLLLAALMARRAGLMPRRKGIGRS